MTTTFEMIQKLSQYPPDTRVVNAYGWNDVVIDDQYLGIDPVASEELGLDPRPCIALSGAKAGEL